MSGSMYFTHLVFTGPQKAPAAIEFGLGLNLIYGPSNTGKSSILDAIDFMFGRKRLLKELPEHSGYEEILLGLNFNADGPYTLVRSLIGGDFTCFEGKHFERPKNQTGEILRVGEPSKKTLSIRDFILDRLDLSGKELKKNQRNEKERLTLRNLAPLLIVDEGDIQREASPFIREQYTSITVDKSRLRFILTGIDDRSLIPQEKERLLVSRTARLQLLSEFIKEGESEISKVGDSETLKGEMEVQLAQLERSIDMERQVLGASEVQYRENIIIRNEARSKYLDAADRLAETSEMLARFSLLNEQYATDMMRLENIKEAGTLFFALPSENCPVCGAKPEFHAQSESCEEEKKEIITAAEGEQGKIQTLQSELKDVIETLTHEKTALEQRLPEMQRAVQQASTALSSISPVVFAQRARFSEVLEKRAEVVRHLDLIDNLSRLQQKADEIEQEFRAASGDDEGASPLPAKSLFELSNFVAGFLSEWGLMADPAVHFNNDTRDFEIDGKHRSSNGKGHRAITHAAATLALLKFTEAKGLPHPGFVVLDSPLLAYEDPENEEDDLSGTFVNLRFLRSLAEWKSVQTIILENKKSIPDEFSSGEGITRFTKSEMFGRYGFFPMEISS
jgi:hypothetical protein